MSLYHNPQIISWHKHTAKTSQMDTATQTEFCHWERRQTNLLTLEKKNKHGHLLLCAYRITTSILRALLAHWAALATAVVLLCKENFSHETSHSFT